MKRLARCLLMLALPFGGLAVAAPAGGGAKKAPAKSSEKTSTKAKPKPAPKSDDEEEGEKSSSTRTKPKDESAATLPASKSSSKVEPKTNLDEDAPRKTKAGTSTAKDKTSDAKRGADVSEPRKKAGQGTARKTGESSDGTAQAKGKSTSKDPAKKSVAKPKRKTPIDEGDDDDPAPANAKAKATAKTKSKSTPKPAAKTPIDNAGDPVAEQSRVTGANATLDPSEIAGFSANSAAVQKLLRLGLELAERDLTYRYGSADPSTGGMDCSGTVYYLLRAAGLKDVPRDSSGLYLWAQEAGTLRTVTATSLDDPQFAALRPGDLLFWEGTYVVRRDPPISHTMIYLGREKTTGSPIMVGASDGRSYRGIRRNGVSVFDFKLPKPDSTARFVAYAKVPGLE